MLAILLLTVAALKPRSSTRYRLYSLRSIGVMDCGVSSSLIRFVEPLGKEFEVTGIRSSSLLASVV